MFDLSDLSPTSSGSAGTRHFLGAPRSSRKAQAKTEAGHAAAQQRMLRRQCGQTLSRRIRPAAGGSGGREERMLRASLIASAKSKSLIGGLHRSYSYWRHGEVHPGTKRQKRSLSGVLPLHHAFAAILRHGQDPAACWPGTRVQPAAQTRGTRHAGRTQRRRWGPGCMTCA